MSFCKPNPAGIRENRTEIIIKECYREPQTVRSILDAHPDWHPRNVSDLLSTLRSKGLLDREPLNNGTNAHSWFLTAKGIDRAEGKIEPQIGNKPVIRDAVIAWLETNKTGTSQAIAADIGRKVAQITQILTDLRRRGWITRTGKRGSHVYRWQGRKEAVRVDPGYTAKVIPLPTTGKRRVGPTGMEWVAVNGGYRDAEPAQATKRRVGVYRGVRKLSAPDGAPRGLSGDVAQ